MSTTGFPWHAYGILWNPSRVARNLDAARASGRFERIPNLWQIELGVLRMWHRMVTRPDSIGTSQDHGVRPGWRSRLFENRLLRLPFLLWEGSVAPWDLSGLLSSPERLLRHMLGTHHDRHQFVYDLQILAMYEGRLDELLEQANRVVSVDDRRSRWLRDLVVFEHYHETLADVVARFIDGAFDLDAREIDDPDISFHAFLDWCADQPATPAETIAAWRRGEFSISSATPEAA